MKITKYPQSCFLIETKGNSFLIDPGNLVSSEVVENFKNIDVVLFTHTHNDHCFVDYVDILSKNNNLQIMGNKEVAEKLNGFDVGVVDAGDIIDFVGTKIEVQDGVHGYLFAMGNKLVPKVNGMVVDDGEKRLYHAGDTIAFYNPVNVDILLAPISGHAVVMEPDIAIEFAGFVDANLIIPMHYESDKHRMGTDRFERLAKEGGVDYKILNNGESYNI